MPEDQKQILSDLIQKQMLVLGPNIALDTARKVAGLEVGDNGGVVEILGDFTLVLKSLVHEYEALSEEVARQTLEWLAKKYPGTKVL